VSTGTGADGISAGENTPEIPPSVLLPAQAQQPTPIPAPVPPMAEPSKQGGIMTVRTTVIFLVAFVFGVLFGVLTYLGEHKAPLAVLAGLAAGGGSVAALNTLID
jgi:hypothetical protein